MKNSAIQSTKILAFESFEIKNLNALKGKGDGEIIITDDIQGN